MNGQPPTRIPAAERGSGDSTIPVGVQTPNRLPSLDGWRGVSIVLVLASHSMLVAGFPPEFEPLFRWLPDGQFGVEIFFVISGFLITSLLLEEAQMQHRVSLSRFYMRRVLRIVPAYSVFLCAVFAVQALTVLTVSEDQWLRLLTWTSNYGSMPWPAGHIWTLSIEEQFYLIWPVAFVLIARRHTVLHALLATCAIPIALCPLFRIASYLGVEGFAFHRYSFLARADSLAWGCVLAVLLFHRRTALTTFVRRRARLLAAGAIAILFCPLVLTRLFLLGTFTVPFGPTANAIGIVSLVALSLEYPRSVAFRWLNIAPVRAVGVWSYSIYLWQQLFCAHPAYYGLNSAPWYLTFPSSVAASVCAGIASYYLVERPFLHLKSRLSARTDLMIGREKT